MGPVGSEGLTPVCTAERAASCDLDLELPHRGVVSIAHRLLSEAQNLNGTQAEAATFRTGPKRISS